MQKVLSISVAAYNVEKFIEQCLDSFVDPAILDRVEVLVTDDGSKDRTPEIVSAYEKKYPGTFRLISQKNAGPGSTVNSGIKHATGKYFRMVDGDDWVNTAQMGAFLDILEKTNADMVCADHCCVDHETGQKKEEKTNVAPCMDVPFSSVCDQLTVAMHNVTYRTDILQKNNIHLDNCFYTDAEYLLYPIPYVKTVTVAPQTIYMYRVSLSTQSMNINSLQRNCAMHELVLGHLSDAYATYENSGMSEPKTAAFLRRNGADVTRVRKLFREDAAEYKAKADAVSQAEIYKQFFAISLCTAEDLPSPTIIGAQAANELLNIKGIKASFVLTDYQGKIYVSARSIDEVNVQIIMERMGGGGHMNTAACQMEGVGLVEAIGVLKNTIDDMLESGEI